MLCSNNQCSGCLSCVNICPKQAIELIVDKQGFWQPHIIKEKCINCNLCHKSCPIFFNFSQTPINSKVYACWHKNPIKRKQSASGGLFTALMLQVLSEDNFYVCGATLTDNFQVKHIIINNSKDYPLLINSKYVQSYLGTIYTEIKKLLLQGNKVLFSGTPCQVAGLYAFLKKRYENQLYTVDLLCHGVPSPQILQKYIFHMEKIYHSKLKTFTFRQKPTWRRYQVVLEFTNGEKNITYKDTNPYIRGFLKGNFLRPSCYNCAYTNLKRISDLTIGDFWNYYADNDNDIDDDKGISMALINTANGDKLFNKAKNQLIYLQKDFEKSTKNSPRLHKPTTKPKTYNNFWQNYFNEDFDVILQKYF